MSLIDKQMLLRELEARLGSFIPADDINKIMIEADDVLIEYEVTRTPEGDGGRNDSEDLLSYYFDAMHVAGRAESTIEKYKYQLNRLLEDTGTSVRRMTIYDIRRYLKSEKARGISPATLEGMRAAYQSFYGWLERDGLIRDNPTRNLVPTKIPKVNRKPFSEVDLALLREAAGSPKARAIIEFLRSTGCRVSEMCSVNRSDVDYQNLKLSVIGKGSKERTVYIDEVAAVYLQRYIKTRKDSDPALFFSRSGTRMKPENVRKILKHLEEITDVENVHPHRFRRTLATTLVNKGAQIQEVAAILGHDKIDTTMSYIYIDERNVENTYRKYV